MRCDSLKELASVSTDVTFAQEFISRDGHLLLVKIVEDSNELVSSSDITDKLFSVMVAATRLAEFSAMQHVTVTDFKATTLIV